MANDFRAYLSTVDPNALAYTGNDARIDPTKAGYDTGSGAIGSVLNSPGNQKKVQDYITGLYQKYQSSLAPSSTNIGSIYGGPPAPVYAPKLDVAAINSQARAAAENAVSPLYTAKLNSFLAQQAAAKQQHQTQYETNIKNLQDTLSNTLQGNETTRGRTIEDTAQNVADINQNADEFQTDSGTAFDKARLAQARGTSTGGLGQQQQEEALGQHNTDESRQVQKFQQAKQQQELFKGRSLEDLFKSDELSRVSSEKGQKQEKFDLDSYLQNAQFAEDDARNQLTIDKQALVEAKTRSYATDAYNNYIQGIANPAQRAAAASQYGSSF